MFPCESSFTDAERATSDTVTSLDRREPAWLVGNQFAEMSVSGLRRSETSMNRGRARPLWLMSHSSPHSRTRGSRGNGRIGSMSAQRKGFEPDLDIQHVVCRFNCLHGPQPPAALVTKRLHDGSPTCHLGPRR